MRVKELILYKNMEEDRILKDISFLADHCDDLRREEEKLRGMLFGCAGRLLETAVSHGFEGDLWHVYLTYLLASHENPYSTSCEIVGKTEGSINDVALHDFAIFKEMFEYDVEELGRRDRLSVFRPGIQRYERPRESI